MTGAALIGIDWGTTSFRAYRIDAGGSVIETRAAPAGILAVRDGDFAARADARDRRVARGRARAAGDRVRHDHLAPGLARGAVLPLPGRQRADRRRAHAPSREAAACTSCPACRLIGADGVPDVIRGEETQIVGEVGDRPGRHLLVLPGTHSKWALAEDGVITWFATFMTGEVFARAEGAQHPRPADAGRGRRPRGVRARPGLCAHRQGRALAAAVQRAHARPVRRAAGSPRSPPTCPAS